MTDYKKASEIASISPKINVYDATLYGCLDMAKYKNNEFRKVIEKVRAMAHAHRTNPEEYEYCEDYNDGFIAAIVAIDKLFKEGEK